MRMVHDIDILAKEASDLHDELHDIDLLASEASNLLDLDASPGKDAPHLNPSAKVAKGPNLTLELTGDSRGAACADEDSEDWEDSMESEEDLNFEQVSNPRVSPLTMQQVKESTRLQALASYADGQVALRHVETRAQAKNLLESADSEKEAWLFATDMDQRNPLHHASLNGFEEVVDELLSVAGVAKERFLQAADRDGWTALHWAATLGHTGVISVLLANTADPQGLLTRRNHLGLTPLHAAMVAQISVDDISASNLSRPYPTFKSVAGVLESLLRTASDKKALFSVRDREGRSVLNVMTCFGYFELLRNFQDEDNRMMLINIADNEGNTALHHAVARGLDQSHDLGFRIPVEYILNEMKNLTEDSLQAFLLARGKSGKTALHLAFEGSDADAASAVQVFLKRAPEPFALRMARDDNGQTPLHLACAKGYFVSTLALLEHWDDEAWSDANAHELEELFFAQDNYGNTPTHCLVMDERPETGAQRERIACKVLQLLGRTVPSGQDELPQILRLLALENVVSQTILDFGTLRYNHQMGRDFLISWTRSYKEFGPTGQLLNMCFCENPIYKPRPNGCGAKLAKIGRIPSDSQMLSEGPRFQTRAQTTL